MVNALDIAINNFMVGIQTPALTKLFTFITHLGDTKVILPLSIILVIALFYQKRNRVALTTALTLLISVLISESLKFLVQRERPLNALILETNPSFPSGHALMSTVFFLLLIFIYKDNIRNKVKKNILTYSCIILIILITLSRLYLNVHWLTDVIAGLVLGTIFALIFRRLKK